MAFALPTFEIIRNGSFEARSGRTPEWPASWASPWSDPSDPTVQLVSESIDAHSGDKAILFQSLHDDPRFIEQSINPAVYTPIAALSLWVKAHNSMGVVDLEVELDWHHRVSGHGPSRERHTLYDASDWQLLLCKLPPGFEPGTTVVSNIIIRAKTPLPFYVDDVSMPGVISDLFHPMPRPGYPHGPAYGTGIDAGGVHHPSSLMQTPEFQNLELRLGNIECQLNEITHLLRRSVKMPVKEAELDRRHDSGTNA